MRVVTFKLNEEVVEKLDELAKRLGMSRSELIRAAITFILTSNNSSGSSGIRVREVRLR